MTTIPELTLKHYPSGTIDVCFPDGTLVASFPPSRPGSDVNAAQRALATAPGLVNDLVTALANALNSLEYLAPEEFDNAEHEATWKAGLQSYRDTLAKADTP
jgi:hypothetical protein